MAEDNLRAFVLAGVRQLGGLADEPDVRTLDILVPEALRERLRDHQYLRLDLAAQALTVGSPVVEAVAEALGRGGCAARAYLNPIYLQGGDLEKKWKRTFHLTAGRSTLLGQALEETTHAVFHFRAGYLTDEREERLYVVAVNLSTRTSYDALVDEWPRLSLDEARAYGELSAPPAPGLDGLKPTIEKALRLRMAPDIERLRQGQEKFLTRELRRLDDYYRALETELRERERRPSSEGQATRLAERRRAIRLDRAKKTRDAVEKHRLRIETEAFALLLIHQPWLRVTMRLESRRETVDRTFYWNPVFKAFAPAACDACEGEISAFSLRASRLLCPSCVGGVPEPCHG